MAHYDKVVYGGKDWARLEREALRFLSRRAPDGSLISDIGGADSSGSVKVDLKNKESLRKHLDLPRDAMHTLSELQAIYKRRNGDG